MYHLLSTKQLGTNCERIDENTRVKMAVKRSYHYNDIREMFRVWDLLSRLLDAVANGRKVIRCKQ